MIDLEPVIKAYYKLLQSIDLNDAVLVRGQREGLPQLSLDLHRQNPVLSIEELQNLIRVYGSSL